VVLAALWAGLRLGARTSRGAGRVVVVVLGTSALLSALWFAFGATVTALPSSL
jgi:hypothetical protein